MAIVLNNGKARITVRPDRGAGATGYDVHDGAAWQPIFRRVPDETEHPFELSNILLVPFSGRVSGGGFTFDGQFHTIERNMATEKYPIHGSAFATPWTVKYCTRESVTCCVSALGPGPFTYDATMTYSLENTALVMQLDVVNRGIRLPFGLGFHPWFVRDSETLLHAPASRVWLERDDHLPKSVGPVTSHPNLNFNTLRALPVQWTNNWFSGWNRKARIDWPRRGMSVDITASSDLDKYVIFSPSGKADFFCFEPVSHPVDAFNLPAGPKAEGMKILSTGDSFSGAMRVVPRAL